MGEITNCNMAFCKIFGYTKKELVGRGIKTLMPKLIAEHHDKFIQRNLDCIKISCYKAVESDVFTFGLHQSKYMFPVSIKLLATPNILNDMHYIAKIKIDRKHTTNTICFLLLNKKKEVVDVTSSCMNMLNISYSTLTNYTVDMNVLAPSLLKKEVLQGCLQKSGGRLVVYHPSFEHRQSIPLYVKMRVESDEAVFKDEVEGLAKGDEGTEFRCKLQELNYESAGKIGYSMMLESMQNSMVTSSTPAPRSVRFPSFQFTYREDLHIFVREMREDESKPIRCDSVASGNLMSSSLSHFMSTYSHDSGFSRSMLTCRRQDLSELSADKFKQLSMGTKMFSMMSAGGKHHHRSMAKSMYQSKFQRPMMGGSPDNKSTSGDHIVVDANNEPLLKKKNSFISVFSEISSKQNKSKHSSYYEALLPKYKHLSKFVMDDAGTRNLVKAIEGQVMYGEGVKTYRIYNGEFFEVVEETYSQLLAREIDTPQLNLGEGRRNIEKKKEEEYKMLRARIKTKNELAKLVNETPYPTSVSAIKPFTVVCIIILSVLLVLEYVYTRYRLQDILSATDTLSQSYSLKQVLLSLWYDSREMFLLSGSGYTAYLQDYSNSTVYIDHLRTKVDTNSYDANQLVDSLSGNGFSFPAVDDAFLNDASISMYLYTSGSDLSYVVTNYSIYQALLIVIIPRNTPRL
ncbi:MAG: PAS domain S-box protein [Candidatus Pacebacteria bacterium]|nr:PAS domain S-box protein [Candidatus Paceibacterota bacterium]